MIRGKRSSGRSENAADYRRLFVERVHQLLKLGYDRLKPVDYRTEEEPAITGELVRAIGEVLDDPASEDWVSCFDVHDDPPVNDSKRKGKRRSRLDVKFVSSERRPRSIFSFEAKRLAERHTTGAYLGEEGLGCFLTGKYARDEEDAGMLGYVQSGNLRSWAERIGGKLEKEPRRYSVASPVWESCHLAEGLDSSHRSRHVRRPGRREMDIYHTLLAFC